MGTEIVDVEIVIQDSSVKVSNFGTILILAAGAPGGMRTYSTSDLSGLTDDGYSVTSDVYRKAVALSGQTPGVDKFKVYPRAATNAQSITLTVTDATEGFIYGPFKVQSSGAAVDVTYTVGAAETTTTVATAIGALIDAVVGVDSAEAVAVITVTPTVALERVYIDNCPRELILKDTSADAGIATDLAAARAADDDFYGLLIDTQSEAEILVVAPLAAAGKKLFIAQTADADVITSSTTDVASDLVTLGGHYTALFFSRYMSTQGGAGWIGTMFARNPGAATWAIKDVPGAGADSLNTTESGFIASKVANVLESVDGIRRVLSGQVSSGRFLDIVRGTDFLAAQVKANVLLGMANSEGIRQTDQGIGQIHGFVNTPLVAAVASGLLSAHSVTVPKIADVSSADKVTRILNGVTFTGQFGGFWHKVVIRGTLKAS